MDRDAVIAELRALVANQAQQLQQQAKRIAELELALARANKDSSTSSKPPSSDLTKPKPKKAPGRRDYVASHYYGWSEFEIEANTQQLLVTTYGIAPYSASQLADPIGLAEILSREPVIVGHFRVSAVPEPDPVFIALGCAAMFFGLMRR